MEHPEAVPDGGRSGDVPAAVVDRQAALVEPERPREIAEVIQDRSEILEAFGKDVVRAQLARHVDRLRQHLPRGRVVPRSALDLTDPNAEPRDFDIELIAECRHALRERRERVRVRSLPRERGPELALQPRHARRAEPVPFARGAKADKGVVVLADDRLHVADPLQDAGGADRQVPVAQPLEGRPIGGERLLIRKERLRAVARPAGSGRRARSRLHRCGRRAAPPSRDPPDHGACAAEPGAACCTPPPG